MGADDVVLYRSIDGVAMITLNRPRALNAIDLMVLEGLSGALERAHGDASASGVIITGSGDRAFCAGADITYLLRASPLDVRAFARKALAVYHRVETLGKVVVAAINGYALGGGLELAEACMLRVATTGARLGHPEVKIGAVAGFGGTTRLPRLIGKGRAADILLTGRLVTAEEALAVGLVNRVVEPGQLVESAQGLLREIAASSLIAVDLTWEAMHWGLGMTLEESALLGADYFGLAASTEDFRLGATAFLEKRSPRFTGK